jgi:glycosyltransferase involved in cell wall biosynthesis
MHAMLRENYSVGRSGIVINNAAWIDEPPSISFTRAKRIRLGHLGVLAREKGLDKVIQTLGELGKRKIDAELVLAGPLRDEASKRLLEQATVDFGERVQYRGILVGDAKTSFYGDLDYFLFPSLYRHETQSLVVPEALAVGTPVIAYDHRFVGEVVGSGGLLIPISEPFATVAADWISQGDSIMRREFALAQSRTLRSRAAGQIDLILEWVLSP